MVLEPEWEGGGWGKRVGEGERGRGWRGRGRGSAKSGMVRKGAEEKDAGGGEKGSQRCKCREMESSTKMPEAGGRVAKVVKRRRCRAAQRCRRQVEG